MFLKIPQNPQENTCATVFFFSIKLQSGHLQLYYKRDSDAERNILRNTFYRTPPVAATLVRKIFRIQHNWTPPVAKWQAGLNLQILLKIKSNKVILNFFSNVSARVTNTRLHMWYVDFSIFSGNLV